MGTSPGPGPVPPAGAGAEPASARVQAEPAPTPAQGEPASALVQAEPAHVPAHVEPAAPPSRAEPAPAPIHAEPAPAPTPAEPGPALTRSRPARAEPDPAPAWTEPAPTPARAEPAPAPARAEPARATGSYFEAVGGEETFRRLVSHFYDGVAADSRLRPLYPEQDLSAARERLQMFLVQYWGGPATYGERRGHPRLRMRHAPFAIGPVQRDAWLEHMDAAVDSLALSPELEQPLRDYLHTAAQSLQNRP